MATPDRQRRRALRLLADAPDGCTEAIMLAHGFTVVLVELIRDGLATVTTERVMVGARKVEVARWRITDAGRRALGERPK
jgi:hypothetical protein